MLDLTALVALLALAPLAAGLTGYVTLQLDPKKRGRALFFLVLSGAALAASLWLLQTVGSFLDAATSIPDGGHSAVPAVAGAALLLFILLPAGALSAVVGACLRLLVLPAVKRMSPLGPVAARPRASRRVGAFLKFVCLLLAGAFLSRGPGAGRVGAFLGLMLLLVSVVLWAALRASQPFLPKYDTQVRIVAIHVLLFVLVVAGTVGSVRIASYILQTGTLLPLAFVPCLLLPTVLLPIAYLAIPSVVRRAFQAAPVSAYRGLSDVAGAIVRRCEALSIAPPVVLVSETPFLSPEVFGDLRRTFLVIPINYDAVLRAVTNGYTPATASALDEFAIQHELAHLRYSDHRFPSWLAAYLWLLLRLWCPIYVTTVIGSFFIPPLLGVSARAAFSDRVGAAAAATIVPLVYLVLLYVLVTAVSRDREILADRRALDELSPEVRAEIMAEVDVDRPTRPAPLALLLRTYGEEGSLLPGAGLAARMINRLTQLDGAGWISRATRAAASTATVLLRRHPSLEARIRSLRSSSDPLLVREGDVQNGFYAGAFLALLFLAWGTVILAFDLRPPNALGDSLFAACACCAIVFTALLLFLPVKHAHHVPLSFDEFNLTTIRKLAYAGLSAAGVVGLTLVLPSFLVGGPRPPLGIWWRLGVFLLGAAYIVTMLAVMLRAAAKLGPWPETILPKGLVHVLLALAAMAFAL